MTTAEKEKVKKGEALKLVNSLITDVSSGVLDSKQTVEILKTIRDILS